MLCIDCGYPLKNTVIRCQQDWVKFEIRRDYFTKQKTLRRLREEFSDGSEDLSRLPKTDQL